MSTSLSIAQLLDEWLNEAEIQIRDQSFLSFDKLVFSCLKVLHATANQKTLILRIALDLGFILNRSQNSNTQETVKEDIISIENNLDPELQGFSRLLDLVLEDYKIRDNISVILNKLCKKNEATAAAFIATLDTLDIYEDIKNILFLEYSKVPVALFLRGLTDIYQSLLPEVDATQLVIKWLKWRRNKESIIELFSMNSELNSIENLLEFCGVNKQYLAEHILCYVCRRAHDDHVLSVVESCKLDQLFRLAGFRSIDFFIEAGFFDARESALEDSADKVVNIFGVV